MKKKLEGNWEELSKKTQELIKEMCVDTFQSNVEAYSEQTEEIEHESRPGFIPFDHNRGGLSVKGFTDLGYIWGSGNYPSHKDARKEIERQIDLSMEYLSKSIYEQFEDILKPLGLTAKDCTYHTIRDLEEKHPELAEVRKNIEDGELDALGGDDNSIMYEIQFMYHGKEGDKHVASVASVVNTEGPYHRSRISWAPNVFCEGFKEVKIKWSNQKELRQQLKKALEKTAKAVF